MMENIAENLILSDSPKTNKETYSLNSAEFKSLELELQEFLDDFYESKRRVSEGTDLKRTVINFKKDIKDNFKRFLHEYNMGFMASRDESRMYFTIELDSIVQQYILYICRFLCSRSSNLKLPNTIQGKCAEWAVMFAINNWLHYFRIPTSVKFNLKSFIYGGDLGTDMCIGKYRLDVKYRDDGPRQGMVLDSKFIEKSTDSLCKDDVLLVQCTNVMSKSLGNFYTANFEGKPFSQCKDIIQEQSLPISISGWITFGEFARHENKKRLVESRYVVDELHDIPDLFIKILDDQADSYSLFKNQCD